MHMNGEIFISPTGALSFLKASSATFGAADVSVSTIANIQPNVVLEGYTDEELKQAMARLLAQARVEVLNDAEVQNFWQLYTEIQRRRELPETAA
jgi:hypothetical protein